MEQKLLSIVVPTKNRYKYLQSFIELVDSFHEASIELVIQDNSDDNRSFLEYLSNRNYSFIVYDYCSENLSVIENSDKAVKAASGKNICFMGDDDLVLKDLTRFVYEMDKRGIESAFFERASYSWPGVSYKVHKIPNLHIPSFTGKIKYLDVKKQLKNLLSHGAVSLDYMPQLYHGVILRSCLDEIYKITGTYFPGPSPDMAVAVALSKIGKKHIICDVPYTVAGTAPKSAGGMGAKHQHKGEIKNTPWLPKDTEEKWESAIPKIWTGPTIYAESAIKSLRAMGMKKELKFFNYYYHYAYMTVFCPDFADLVNEKLKGDFFGRLKVCCNIVGIFAMRVRVFMKNFMTFKLGITKDILKNDVATSFQAGNDINLILEQRKITPEILFKKCIDC